MSMNNVHFRQMSSTNSENPTKNIKSTLLTSRKKNALKVLTNTVQSTKKCDNKRQLKVLPMQKFENEVKCKSPFQEYNTNDDSYHYNCTPLEKDFLPPSMSCNIGMLSNFFGNKKSDENDWFLEDYSKTMINKIKNTFENFGEPEIEHSIPSLPIMEFPDLFF